MISGSHLSCVRFTTRRRRTGAQLVVCQAWTWFHHLGARIVSCHRFVPTRTVHTDELLDLVLRAKICGYLWNKLFERSILGSEPFPRLSSQSDLAGLITTIGKVMTCALVARTLYRHVAQANSITTSANPNILNILQCGEVMRGELKRRGKSEESDSARYFFTRVIRYATCNTAYRLCDLTPEIRAVIRQTRAKIRIRDIRSVLTVSPHDAAPVVLLRYSAPIYRLLLNGRWRNLRNQHRADQSATLRQRASIAA